MSDVKQLPKEIADKQDKTLTTSFEHMTLHIDQALEETNELLKDSFTVFDTQMQEEVQRTIDALGSGLASLSNKFVEDYSPLTEKLRSVVRMLEEQEVAET